MIAEMNENEKDPPGDLTPKEQKNLAYDRKLAAKLVGKGWLRRIGINTLEGMKFWRWGVKEFAIWTASSNFTLGQVAGGAWVKTNWTLVVLPFLKGLASSAWLAVKSVFFTAVAFVTP